MTGDSIAVLMGLISLAVFLGYAIRRKQLRQAQKQALLAEFEARKEQVVRQ